MEALALLGLIFISPLLLPCPSNLRGLMLAAVAVALVVALGSHLRARFAPGPGPKQLSYVDRASFRQEAIALREKLLKRGDRHGHAERKVRIRTRDGMATLEALVQDGDGKSDIAVIITHPWGVLGGNMHFPIVEKLAQYFGWLGFAVCRFNFRGVGRSIGSSTFTARGEEEDLRSVIDYFLKTKGDEESKIKRVILIGYSYGSMIASSVAGETEELAALVSLSYPYTWNWALAVCNSGRMLKTAARALPSLWIMGSEDEFTAPWRFKKLCRLLSEKDSDAMIVEGQGHHWINAEGAVASIITKWLKKNEIIPQDLLL